MPQESKNLQKEAIKKGKKFLEDVLGFFNPSFSVEEKVEKEAVKFDIKGKELGTVIGKYGQTLSALQFLTNLVANRGGKIANIIVDAQGYRKKREERLIKIAKNAALKVKETKKDVALEPMSAEERKIIHNALKDNPDVYTHAEGEGQNRHIIISPRQKQARK
jgi:spoIIIJ-associated protein